MEPTVAGPVRASGSSANEAIPIAMIIRCLNQERG